jgi:hypothetical protein
MIINIYNSVLLPDIEYQILYIVFHAHLIFTQNNNHG